MAAGNGYKRQYGKNDAAKEENARAIAELKRRLANGDTEGLYIFTGDEEYMKRHYFGELCKSAGDSVNIVTIRGEVDFGELCDELSSVPMQELSLFEDLPEQGAPKRVIKLDAPDFSKLSDRESDELTELLCDVGKMSVVVIYFSNIDNGKSKSTSAMIKRLSENAVVCNFERAQPGDATLLRWIKKHFDKEKLSITSEDVRYLSDCVGTDMCLLAFEIEKLSAYLQFSGRSNVTRSDIDYICIKNAEAITFDVTGALTALDFEGAIESLRRLRITKTEPLMIFGAITKTVNDIATVASMTASGKTSAEIMHEGGLRDFVVRKYQTMLRNLPKGYAGKATRLCLRADEKLKRGADGYLVLENLLFELIK